MHYSQWNIFCLWKIHALQVLVPLALFFPLFSFCLALVMNWVLFSFHELEERCFIIPENFCIHEKKHILLPFLSSSLVSNINLYCNLCMFELVSGLPLPPNCVILTVLICVSTITSAGSNNHHLSPSSPLAKVPGYYASSVPIPCLSAAKGSY